MFKVGDGVGREVVLISSTTTPVATNVFSHVADVLQREFRHRTANGPKQSIQRTLQLMWH
jgi:hypothetical protein